MLKGNIFTYIFLFLGIGFISIGYLLSRPSGKGLTKPQQLGQIEKLSGNASLTRKNHSRSTLLGDSEPLYVLDTIETHKQSQIEILFKNDSKIRLNAETKVIIDQEGDVLLVILSKGSFSIENFGARGNVSVSYQGHRVKLQDWEQWLNSQNVTPKNPLNSFSSSEQLSENLISDTIQAHKIKFLQCYNKLLQKTPGVSGSVTLAFTIQKSGRVNNPTVASSVLTDSSFKSCLFEVLNRIEFKAFEGEAISTVIPLNFE